MKPMLYCFRIYVLESQFYHFVVINPAPPPSTQEKKFPLVICQYEAASQCSLTCCPRWADR